MAVLCATGRLGRDAEVRTVGQNKCASFSIAVDHGFGDNKKTMWIDCAMWGPRGEKLAQYLTKGTIAEISGEPSIRTFESNGATKAVMQVRVDGLKLHGGGKRDEPRADNARATQGQGPAAMDNDIPFMRPWQ